jgi:hypothetical protein
MAADEAFSVVISPRGGGRNKGTGVIFMKKTPVPFCHSTHVHDPTTTTAPSKD